MSHIPPQADWHPASHPALHYWKPQFQQICALCLLSFLMPAYWVSVALLLIQEQAQAARKRAAGTMDEYTFIAEDTEAAKQDGEPVVQHVSSEQVYNTELAQELQVHSAKHIAA